MQRDFSRTGVQKCTDWRSLGETRNIDSAVTCSASGTCSASRQFRWRIASESIREIIRDLAGRQEKSSTTAGGRMAVNMARNGADGNGHRHYVPGRAKFQRRRLRQQQWLQREDLIGSAPRRWRVKARRRQQIAVDGKLRGWDSFRATWIRSLPAQLNG